MGGRWSIRPPAQLSQRGATNRIRSDETNTELLQRIIIFGLCVRTSSFPSVSLLGEWDSLSDRDTEPTGTKPQVSDFYLYFFDKWMHKNLQWALIGNMLRLKHISIWKDQLSALRWKHHENTAEPAAPVGSRSSLNETLLVFLSVHLDMRRECTKHLSSSLPLISYSVSVTLTILIYDHGKQPPACEFSLSLSLFSVSWNLSILLIEISLSVRPDHFSAGMIIWSCCCCFASSKKGNKLLIWTSPRLGGKSLPW